MNEVLKSLINYISNTPDSIFFSESEGIYTKFDKTNLIDFYVFNFFIDHQDFWNHNYFIVRNSHPNKFFLIPWDFDRSFGQYAWNDYDVERNPNNEIRGLNELYNRLLNNTSFKEECKNRWFELRETIWTEERILNMLNEMYETIEDVLETEINMWNNREPIVSKEERKNIIEDSIEDLHEWISERLNFCDFHFTFFLFY